MTFQSVLDQMASVLTGSGLVTSVVRGDRLKLSAKGALLMTPDQCPGVIITRGKSTETLMSTTITDRTTPYTCGVWYYGTDPANDPTADADLFDTLMERLQALLRPPRALGGLADTATTKVLFQRVMQSDPLPRPFTTAKGKAVWHESFQIHVREEVRS